MAEVEQDEGRDAGGPAARLRRRQPAVHKRPEHAPPPDCAPRADGRHRDDVRRRGHPLEMTLSEADLEVGEARGHDMNWAGRNHK